MKIIYLLLVMDGSIFWVISGHPDYLLQSHWQIFKARHRKLFPNATEENRRLKIWSQRKRTIDQHNLEAEKGLHSYTLETNAFSDKDDVELKRMLGIKLPSRNRLRPPIDPVNLSPDRGFPPSLDYRGNPCLSPIKNQGNCGSCWAFAAIALPEFQACKKTGTLRTLSEQQLVDCSSSNSGCDGGFYTFAWMDLEAEGGIMTSASYPYSAMVGTCAFKATGVAVKVASYNQLTANNPTSIMRALTKGPVAASINVVSSFYSYKSGVYADTNCNTKSTDTVNHAIVIVGYGSHKGIPHWIVRNSWGEDWGMSGYVYIKRGVNQCNIESWPATMSVA